MDESAPRPRVSRWHLHRRLYDWVLHWADTRFGAPALFALAFAESSFFPVPPDVLLIALVLGARQKAWRLASLCSFASVVGGIAGYLLGMTVWKAGVDDFFFRRIPGFDRDRVVTTSGTAVTGLVTTAQDQWPIELESATGERQRFARQEVREEPEIGWFTWIRWRYEQYDFLVVFTAGFTPIPYKLITITSGVFGINFPVFLIASATSRSARFFLVAGLLWWIGPSVKRWIDRYFNWVSFLFVAALVGGFVVLKYIRL